MLSNFKNIVLCGVDLKDNNYFYSDIYYKNKYGWLSDFSANDNNFVHKTNDPGVHRLTIEKIINSLNQVLLKPNGISLMIGTENSQLSNHYPKYDWTNN